MDTAEFHVHTNASWCAAAEMSAEAVAARAAQAGLGTLGLADHLWLDPRRGSRPAVSRLLALRGRLAGLPPGGPRVLLGAEADCAPGLGLAGGAETAKLDYVIAAYHFSELRAGRVSWPQTPEELAHMMLEGFRSLIDAPEAAVAGHPFFIPPRVYQRLAPAVRDQLADAFAIVRTGSGRLFQHAARRNVAIELNAKALGDMHRPALLPVFRLAKEAGCKFVLSSDAHRLAEVGRSQSLEAYMREIGFTSSDRFEVS